ncbi:Bromodomain-containing protein [Russula dissimulans]|nr:Bromodomain-containing protein [Russula dissimulans]
MSKRELGKLASVVDVDAPRAKRRREVAPHDEKKPDPDTADHNALGEANVKQEQEDPAQVKEQGSKLWQTVKDAVDKECVTGPSLLTLINHDPPSGRSLSVDFLRLPNKRTYPDYYIVIKKPISLDKIKSQLDEGQYLSVLAVKNDLEQCFRNAKRYNLRDSQIFNDAKFLHKLTSKEYVNMTGDTKGASEGHEEDLPQDDGNESGLKDGMDDEAKKKKIMIRLLTARLDKLVAKKDDAGNALSNDFMELPSKRVWAIYYKTISRPMSFEKIYKHLKRKEYSNVAQFAQDVELVFSNAMQFNEDHTPLWEAARQLKEYFSKLMSDLPAPYTVPQYVPKDPQRPSNGKIKLKVPQAQQSQLQTSTSTTAASPPQAQTSLVLKVPAKDAHAHASTVSLSPIAGPSSTTASSGANSQVPSTLAPGRKSTNPPAQSQPPATQTRAPSLRSVALTITPTHRRLALDARDGVRSWSLRLAPSERGLRISDVRLLRTADSDDDNDESEEEDEQEEEEEDEEEGGEGNEEGGDVNGTDGGAGEGKDAAVRARKAERVGRVKLPPPMLVRLDKTEVECRGRGRWEVTLGPGAGARVLELSDTRGDSTDPNGVWRVYLYCTA